MTYSYIIDFLNNSPFISGCVMLLMNLGGKYVVMEIPNGMHSFFEHPWVRKITILSIAFVATRNIKTSILISLLFILFSRFLMNEKSRCCISFIKQYHIQKQKDKFTDNSNILNKKTK